MNAPSTDPQKSRRPGQTRLSPAELSQRGRVGSVVRRGGDVELARRVFNELKFSRELFEAAGRLVEARTAQGLPPRITDTATLARLAVLIVGDAPEKRKEVPADAAART